MSEGKIGRQPDWEENNKSIYKPYKVVFLKNQCSLQNSLNLLSELGSVTEYSNFTNPVVFLNINSE